MEWTPCSPDMACMIERCWGWMKQKLRKQYFTTVEQLIAAIKDAWMEID